MHRRFGRKLVEVRPPEMEAVRLPRFERSRRTRGAEPAQERLAGLYSDLLSEVCADKPQRPKPSGLHPLRLVEPARLQTAQSPEDVHQALADVPPGPLRPVAFCKALSHVPAAVARSALVTAPSDFETLALNSAVEAVLRDEGPQAALELAQGAPAAANAYTWRLILESLGSGPAVPSVSLCKEVWRLAGAADPLTVGLYVSAALRAQSIRKSDEGFSAQVEMLLASLSPPPSEHVAQAVLDRARSVADVNAAVKYTLGAGLVPTGTLMERAFAAVARLGSEEAMPFAFLLLEHPSVLSGGTGQAQGINAALQAAALLRSHQWLNAGMRVAYQSMRPLSKRTRLAVLPLLVDSHHVRQAWVPGCHDEHVLLKHFKAAVRTGAVSTQARALEALLSSASAPSAFVGAALLEAPQGWEEVLGLYETLLQKGMEPSEAHFCAMLDTVRSADTIVNVREILRLMVTAKVAPGEAFEAKLLEVVFRSPVPSSSSSCPSAPSALSPPSGGEESLHLEVARMALQQLEAHFETLRDDREGALLEHTQATYELLEYAVQDAAGFTN